MKGPQLLDTPKMMRRPPSGQLLKRQPGVRVVNLKGK
jgi:hypothetical protein